MADIVERLRELPFPEHALRDAADEIEKLRAALADRDALIAELQSNVDEDAISALSQGAWREVGRILSRAPQGAADRHDNLVRAEAWDEGRDDERRAALRKEFPLNPYRNAAEQ